MSMVDPTSRLAVRFATQARCSGTFPEACRAREELTMWAYAHDAGRLLAAVTLLLGGASKLVSPRPLAVSLGQVFGWVRPVAIVVARVVATVELVAAILLASPSVFGAWALTVGLALTGLVGVGIVGYATI